MIFRLKSEKDTHQAGLILGEMASSGDLFCLSGTLGAGKTYLTKGIAESLGIDPSKVTSPTFTLVQEYFGKLPLYHWDLYRLEDPSEALDLGLEDHLDGDGLTVIEWAELLENELPKERLSIRLIPDGDCRNIEILASSKYQKTYAMIKERFSSCFA
ncbi:MAG: tRNA (adenosine(37)-N6)-threonylcarbamoyltransferase complex ATPase subunit type 1 TsaE [Firmicutes bacterium]|nr:tRNA (adenosine(37)-N6)-threonylcarbamoyltransferase complex ATPase subunit type 1 TsaE [Bacillota bacterium]MDD4264014.1 tRNA (adenosine(37)-N6)-threonylcarbamoyltransferase complex ATPase subunit type 1 TsaE [Bacillota bacterium]MDD4694077.1 tRNA (adenosine(37)-N6)-threonylcarbamoyltransferase complex ATPase subunit type 1 TsaE [Bacillota bacterium]